MGNLDNILRKKLKSLGVERQVEAAGVVEIATAEIAKYIPREDFEVISFKNKTLKVSAVSSVVANELLLAKPKIIERIEAVKEINIKTA